MKNNYLKFIGAMCAILCVLMFQSCSSSSSKKSCTTSDSEYQDGYREGQVNRDGGSSDCDPYRNNKVEGHDGYVNDGSTIRPVRSDCFCKGYDDGYKSKK